MGFLDKAKEQASALAAKAQEGVNQGQAKLSESQANKKAAGLLEQLGVSLDARGNVARDGSWRTDVPDVFVCGDMGRGQSLIVWAIAEGRACAAAVDEALTGSTMLPAVLEPTRR